MSGLTKLGKEIIDFYDSGMTADLIAVVLSVSEAIVGPIIAAYAGTADHSDFMEELDGGTLPMPVAARRRHAGAHL